MARSQKDILMDLCSFNPSSSSKSSNIWRNRYMILVGSVTNRAHLKQLTDLITSQDGRHGAEVDHPELMIMGSEKIEFILEYMTLYQNTEQIAEQCQNYPVYEDHLHPAVMNTVQKNPSYKKLRTVCRFYEKTEDVDVDRVMAEHDKLTAKSSTYFIKKGVSIDEANALALALSFYTGTQSEAVQRGASLIARLGNGESPQKSQDELNEAAIMLYYLVKALSYIPYYWGYVTRSCQLTDEELHMYTPGSLITWIKFNSSKKGNTVAGGEFQKRNTYFKIYSLTGRSIQQFSNFPNEDEVLFLPHSTFIVFKHEISCHATMHTIYLRQVELGLSQWSVLWVDDQIFVEDWGNKGHMEHAAAKALNKNVHFIAKSSTDNALSFLRSPFGQRLKNQDTFRIVTDMYRRDEKPAHNAGARLIRNLRKMGFQNQCLIFAGDKKKTDEIIQSELNSNEREFVKVTIDPGVLETFVNFE